MSYQPPVEIEYGPQRSIKGGIDEAVMLAIEQELNIKVDKVELIRAMQYDRGQYEKGYADGAASQTRHGRWIECDYKHLEHGFMETEPNAGLCCSECRTAFQKKKMTYKQYCAACGAKMDGGG